MKERQSREVLTDHLSSEIASLSARLQNALAEDKQLRQNVFQRVNSLIDERLSVLRSELLREARSLSEGDQTVREAKLASVPHIKVAFPSMA
jgi:hypothetical protein